ncbi:GTP pyrophosphokinase [Klebsiella aerogenes]|uniref:GTP pyrophosphokinase n=1 Tax=Klebsiella aerogenes TaxID=548 RepID=UPI0009BF9C7B|nr:RelA/SpoT domain-containing protein [Klebsiella aerogenes]
MTNEEIKEQHVIYGSVAEMFRKVMVEQIDVILSDNKLSLGVPIESRVKTLSSIMDKDNRKSLKINSIVELDDYIGIRLIMLFKRDIEKVISCLKGNFIILKEENKLDELEEDKFGYQSHHYVIQPPAAWLGVPSFSNFKDMKIEVQIRTLSQHIWAAASHKLQYKKEQSVPLPLRRAINRVSALLEVVDFEFERVLIEREGYIGGVGNIEQLKNQSTLDVELLKLIAEIELPAGNKSQEENYDDLLSELIKNGILTVGACIDKLREGLPSALVEDKNIVSDIINSDQDIQADDEIERAHQGVFFSHVGLIRTAISNAIGISYIRNQSLDEDEDEDEDEGFLVNE